MENPHCRITRSQALTCAWRFLVYELVHTLRLLNGKSLYSVYVFHIMCFYSSLKTTLWIGRSISTPPRETSASNPKPQGEGWEATGRTSAMGRGWWWWCPVWAYIFPSYQRVARTHLLSLKTLPLMLSWNLPLCKRFPWVLVWPLKLLRINMKCIWNPHESPKCLRPLAVPSDVPSQAQVNLFEAFLCGSF